MCCCCCFSVLLTFKKTKKNRFSLFFILHLGCLSCFCSCCWVVCDEGVLIVVEFLDDFGSFLWLLIYFLFCHCNHYHHLNIYQYQYHCNQCFRFQTSCSCFRSDEFSCSFSVKFNSSKLTTTTTKTTKTTVKSFTYIHNIHKRIVSQ